MGLYASMGLYAVYITVDLGMSLPKSVSQLHQFRVSSLVRVGGAPWHEILAGLPKKGLCARPLEFINSEHPTVPQY